jgi:outer membrane protein OmpA-like peptidoglycan-associated protein
MKKYNWVAAAMLAVSLAVMQGCASKLSQLSDDGKSDRIVFPDVAKDAWLKGGTAPGLDRLRSVAPGMNKDQLYAQLGRPHFQEGFVGVREWDYVFNLPTGQGSESMSCQYKVVFEPDYRVRATHWRTQACADLVAEKAPAPVASAPVASPPAPVVVERIVEKAVPVVQSKRMQLATDTLFAYKKFSLGDLLPGGIQKLDQLAGELRGSGEFDQVTLTGHTDRIGSDAYNLNLSRERASTVRDYLVAKGIPAQRITATGLGEAVPLVNCPERSHAVMVECLKPNRRVEIEAWYVQKQ